MSEAKTKMRKPADMTEAMKTADMAEVTKPVIKEIRAKSILSKSNLPVCEYAVNPYVGCTHGCRYCYANDSPGRVRENVLKYDESSPLLCGCLQDRDIITERKMKSLKI